MYSMRGILNYQVNKQKMIYVENKILEKIQLPKHLHRLFPNCNSILIMLILTQIIYGKMRYHRNILISMKINRNSVS